MITGLKPYPAYRDSGVEWLGEVPEGWEVRRLRYASEALVNGLWGGDPDGVSDIACVRVADFDRLQMRVRAPVSTMRSITPAEQRRRLLRRGDLLLEKSGGGDQTPVGAVVEYAEAAPAVTSNFVARMRPRQGFHPRCLVYLHAALYSTGVNARSIKQTTGIQNLDGYTYLSEKVAFAPPHEQVAIARFLDHVDSQVQRLIVAKSKLIELLEEEKQATVHRVVIRGFDPEVPLKSSGVDWLGDVPAHWEVVPLGLRYSVKLGKMLDAKRITGAALLPYLRNTDVQWDKINTVDLPTMDISPDEYGRYTVEAGDLLVCEGGEVGRAAIWDQPGTIGYQKALHRVRPRQRTRDSPRFLYYCLQSMASLGVFKADGGESTIAHLTAEKLRRHRFPFPPAQEQIDIAEMLDRELRQRDIVIAKANSDIALLREYRTRLISDVVTGKLDVREVAAKLPADPEEDDSALDEHLEEVMGG